jgi:acyl dehydratase
MTIDCNALKTWPFTDVEQIYTEKDSIFYALAVGYGADPMEERELPFFYEKNLVAVPTMAVVLSYPGLWIADPKSGIDWLKTVHGEQSVRFHRPLPGSGTVVGRTRVASVIDKGPGKGALFVQERTLRDKASGEPLATLEQVNFCRGDGGYSLDGGADGKQVSDAPIAAPHPLPDTPPQWLHDIPTLPQQALFYRLCADRHPIHVDPRAAREAGFPRPILHGLATFGIAGHALLSVCCDYQPARLKSMRVRFSAPVFPGETIRTEIWPHASGVSFRCRALQRDVIILNNGYAEID